MLQEKEPEPRTSFVKYVFLDVIDFTRNRSVEAQSDIVYRLNEIVRAAVIENQIPDEARLYLPTGDGVCIALFRTEQLPYDIHLKVALGIISKVDAHNIRTKDIQRKFTVRVGLNENTDNLIGVLKPSRLRGRPLSLRAIALHCCWLSPAMLIPFGRY